MQVRYSRKSAISIIAERTLHILITARAASHNRVCLPLCVTGLSWYPRQKGSPHTSILDFYPSGEMQQNLQVDSAVPEEKI